MVNQENIRRSQNSFSGGEISNRLLGRVDLAKFNTGVRLGKNVFVEIEGGISNRGGLEHGNRTKTDTGVIRFQPFEAPGEVNYVMEITPLAIRFIFDNALVLAAGIPIVVVTPYTAEHIMDLVFTQSNDIMTITHNSYAPRELRRTAFNAWSLVGITPNPAVTAPTLSSPSQTGGAGGEVTQSYMVSTIDLLTGAESLPSNKVNLDNDLTTLGDKIILQWNEVAGADAYVVYKRRAGQYGFMGFVRAEDQFSGTAPTRVYQVTDNNINPNASQTPKRAEDPFPTVDDYPAIGFFFQQRRAFAASTNGPNTIINSQLGIFDGFRKSIPSLPDDSFSFALGAARTQQIKAIIAVDDLILFTSSNEWRLRVEGGYSGASLPDVRPQSSVGISNIPPLVVGTDIMYVQAAKKTVYRMNYSFDFNRFVSDDISIMSKHLFRNRSIKAWCYTAEPFFKVFGYFDDGKAFNFTYNREQQISGWTRYETDGFIEACCSIRENGIDRLYVAVKRRVGGVFRRFFEREDIRVFNNVTEAFFVDCGVKYDDYVPIFNVMGGVITTADENGNAGPHGMADGQTIRLYDIVGSFPGEPNRDINTRYRLNLVNDNSFTLTDYDTLTDVNIDTFDWLSGGKVRATSNVIGGLGHLEGRAVSVLADGFVVEGRVVSGSQVMLDEPAGIRIAGLPYSSTVHTLELESEQEPTRGRKKSVANFVMRVDETRGLKVGLREDIMYELKERDYEPYNDPVRPGAQVVRVPLGPGWDDELKIIVQQDYPLPMTLLSVIPEYTVGDS